ncbi:MAG: hypothetical protein COX90_00655 [Candidatus Nealsonbacteria bacterium CG_4_10_14_0_2_um_filter_38_17]|uniref:Excinuclease ABC subunit C n=2 Tax=Candidatus Nealsoniibacteriota TaxID=1817911 RepID=A0A2M7UYY8_9BACT|nr:MAG: hypothetical protein COX36_01045 [Candidatus Nealsonbacteria bacterium CG23_combo_of_CG06-09_8_20_14_all_38_19]PIZ89194.1 MAG: hypothetical protein COX90_00655 [Candidatus Nealsonbacteria bacterium CG_4_10_14_0_2_um_filter_38_17]
MEKFGFLKKDQIERLPASPGVYYLKNRRKILYIGKASNIRERVKTHFQQPSYRDNIFIEQITKIGYLKTVSEIEALILEANLIKKYQPKYNVMWRDDKNYFWVALTKEDFPQIFITHQPTVSSSLHLVSRIPGRKNTKYKIQDTRYVGPFVDGKSLKQALKILRKVFPYRTCRNFPKKPCLWYHLDRCPAPCLTKSDLAKQIPISFAKMKDEVQRNTKAILGIIQGKRLKVLKKLKKGMKKLAQEKEFEKAAKIRDQVFSLEKVLANAKIFGQALSLKSDYIKTEKLLSKIFDERKFISRIEAYDISNIQGKTAAGSMVTFINGLPDKNFYRKFKIRLLESPNDVAMIEEVLSRRFKHLEWGLPDLILIDGGKAQLNVVVKSKLKSPNFKKIKIIALAKRKNELFIESKKKSVFLKILPREVFNLILQLRDEAHRFARKYHHKLKKKDTFSKD